MNRDEIIKMLFKLLWEDFRNDIGRKEFDRGDVTFKQFIDWVRVQEVERLQRKSKLKPIEYYINR